MHTTATKKKKDFLLNFIHGYFIQLIQTAIFPFVKKYIYTYCKMIMNGIMHVLHKNVHHYYIIIAYCKISFSCNINNSFS